MATPINTIKNWFKTGLIPTQDQFWAFIDAFRHKDAKIPVADVEGIDELLAGKASTASVNNLNTDVQGRLPKGSYAGTAKDLDDKIDAKLTDNPFLGTLTPTDVPVATPVKGYFETSIAGTYTNAGGVVVPANSTAKIFRSAAGVYAVTFTTNNFADYVKKTESIPVVNNVNLYIKNTATYGQYINGQYLQPSGSTRYVSDYISVNPSDVLYFYDNVTPSSKKYLVFNSSNAVIANGESDSVTIPSGGVKIKIDTNSAASHDTLMAIKGAAAPTKYVPAQYSPTNLFGRELSIPTSCIQDEVVSQETLKTKKITALQTEYLNDSINLVNLNKCLLGYSINSGGYVVGTNGWVTTDYLPITQNSLPYSWNFGNWVAYDEFKVKITGVTLISGTIISSNVKFVRAFWGNNIITTAELLKAQKVFFGIANAVPSPFVGYGKTFDPNEIEVIDSKRDAYLPFKGKKMFKVGDSYTMQAGYFNKLIELTMATSIGSTGVGGNGMPMTGFANNITTNHAAAIAQADIVTILGGTNDYNHGSATLGTFSDAAGANTIYGAVKGIINAVASLNPNAVVVFFTQPERGAYLGNPVNTIPPAFNNQGLNMYSISEAIYDCCSRLGVPCKQTHHTLWRLDQINTFTSDLLHPNNVGGDRLGAQMAKFINTL